MRSMRNIYRSMKSLFTQVMNGKLFITYTSSFDEITSEDDFDKIEVLSTEIDNSDEFFLAPISSFKEIDQESLERQEKERRRVVRVVALVSGILLLVSVILVAVSLYMSKDIDEMGKPVPFDMSLTGDFQRCGILTSVDSDEPVQPPFRLRNLKWCSVSS